MSSRSHENTLLNPAEKIVEAYVRRYAPDDAQGARFHLLESVVGRIGGPDMVEYRKLFGDGAEEKDAADQPAAMRIVDAIDRSGLPRPLAVSALAREALVHPSKRVAGAYHTDYRLALHLARRLAPTLEPGDRVLDPACGAGMLLTALMMETCGGDRSLAARWIEAGVNAADISPLALRGTLLSLACLTDDLDALAVARARWLTGDSLLRSPDAWRGIAPNGFDAIIANPPWEKIKLTRHEFLRAQGVSRHYGADYTALDDGFLLSSDATKRYARSVSGRHEDAGAGETDLFVAFTSLCHRLLRRGGEAALLVPAGLIRSKSTAALRRSLCSGATDLSFEIFDNRARFFEIDTRFKFLSVHWRAGEMADGHGHVSLAHGRGVDGGIAVDRSVRMERAVLAQVRPDLSVPEIRSDEEWRLFRRMSETGVDWSQPHDAWHPEFMREVDMTRDRHHFLADERRGALPLIEGRMVHQHRFGAKAYVSGTGRSAVWETVLPGDRRVAPQFFIERQALSAGALRRSERTRAGFCDITGQTNERSCLAAVIPPGVACGNKVPTLLFPNDPREERLWLWVAIANSLPFDWLLRRVITTTVNYFHLLSLRLPPVDPDSLPGRNLVEIARRLDRLDRSATSTEVVREMARLRAHADRLVMVAYGLTDDDMDVMLADFPLLDRAQPPIMGERRSTVTRDLLFGRARDGERAADARTRVAIAQERGAVGYFPSQWAGGAKNDVMVAAHG